MARDFPLEEARHGSARSSHRDGGCAITTTPAAEGWSEGTCELLRSWSTRGCASLDNVQQRSGTAALVLGMEAQGSAPCPTAMSISWQCRWCSGGVWQQGMPQEDDAKACVTVPRSRTRRRHVQWASLNLRSAFEGDRTYEPSRDLP